VRNTQITFRMGMTRTVQVFTMGSTLGTIEVTERDAIDDGTIMAAGDHILRPVC
jgi:hypothetical protein